MSVDELIKSHDPKLILTAAERIKQTEEIRKALSGSRWAETPLIFDKTPFLLPAFEGYRPLAVMLHHYGLWMEPIYTSPPSGEPDRAFALHINESEEGLRIYIEDAFAITIQGNYELGFVLKTELKENTSIQTESET